MSTTIPSTETRLNQWLSPLTRALTYSPPRRSLTIFATAAHCPALSVKPTVARTAVSGENAFSRSARIDFSRRLSFELVFPPTNEEGNFTLKIEASGFVSRETTSIVLGANDQQYFDETLEVSSEHGMGGAVSIAAPTDPLVFAVVVGDLAAIKEMLATGTDVNSVDEEYGTALSQAVSNGNREIVAVLINAGADVNKVSNGGHTALMSITGSTTSDIIWTLMDAGAKTDLKDEDGGTALHYAATNASPDALRALLNGGGSVDARDTEDQTALMIAANAGNSDNVLVLLKAGASVNLRDEDGTTALGLALENDNDETVRVLLGFGATE